MRALYSLLSRLRTLYALAQGIVAFLHTGWAGLTPLQLLTVGLVLCIVLRVLTFSASSAWHGRAALVDHLLNRIAATSVIALHAISSAVLCTSCVRLLVLAR